MSKSFQQDLGQPSHPGHLYMFAVCVFLQLTMVPKCLPSPDPSQTRGMVVFEPRRSFQNSTFFLLVSWKCVKLSGVPLAFASGRAMLSGAWPLDFVAESIV
jgi:hypothetical protein